jgi:hypothetical protein
MYEQLHEQINNESMIEKCSVDQQVPTGLGVASFFLV